jgi:DinB superfamily
MTIRPERDEAAEYYFGYIDQVPEGDILATLERQQDEMLELLGGISEEQSLHRYEPGKWSLRETLAHLNDTERLFVFRAMWFARGFDTPLPSFDQLVAVGAARSDDIPWARHVDEFRAIRDATLAFFRHLPGDAWTRRGIASDNSFTVRALAYMTAGHAIHHAKIIRTRYLAAPGARA